MRKLIGIAALFGLLCLSAGLGLWFAWTYWFAAPARGGRPAAEAGGESQRLNILLVGEDARPGEQVSRADTIILATLDRKMGRAALVSIPRDSLVDIPGHGKNRINAALPLGGLDLLRLTVGNLLGVNVDRYVLVDFQGFEQVVDDLGGVDIMVDKDMQYRADDVTIDLHRGQQHLNGNQALQYVRFRHDALGDITRTQRQQKFLQALARQAATPATLARLPRLISSLRGAVQTDLSPSEILALGRLVQGGETELASTTLPGSFQQGSPYWYPDPENAQRVVENLLAGKLVAETPVEAPQEKDARTLAQTGPAPSTKKPAVKMAPVKQPSGQHSEEKANPPAAPPASSQASTGTGAPDAGAQPVPALPPQEGLPPSGGVDQTAPGAEEGASATPAPPPPAPGESAAAPPATAEAPQEAVPAQSDAGPVSQSTTPEQS